MLFIKSNILTVVLMFMVFVGQASATTSGSCQMNTKDQNIHLSMETTNHITKDMAAHIGMSGSATQSSMDDCCAQDCDCALGGCSLVMLLPSPHHAWEVIALKKMGRHPFLVTRQSPPTLYRPPISL